MANKEELLAEAESKGVAVPEGSTKAQIQEILDDHAKTTDNANLDNNDGGSKPEGDVPSNDNTELSNVDNGEEPTPAEVAAEDVEKAGVQGVTKGDTVVGDGKADTPDAKSDGSNREDQTVAVQANGIDGVDRDHTPAGTTDEANEGDAGERIQPPVAANGVDPAATQETYDANNSTSPTETPAEVKAREHEENADKVATREDEAKEVETDLGSSSEEAAAARSGVNATALDNPRQNREPKNAFEESNQKVTEEERQAAQKVSDMTTAAREDETPTPNEAGTKDAAQSAEANQGSEIARAILEASNGQKNFVIAADETVDPRFAVVKNADGEVMIRENSTGHLSKVQLESLEEKENSIQNQEVTEV